MKNKQKKKQIGSMVDAYMATLRVPHAPTKTEENKKRKIEKKVLRAEMRGE